MTPYYITKCKGDTLTILSPHFSIPQKTKKVVHNDCTYDDTVNEPNWDDFTVQGPGLLPYNRINKLCVSGSLAYCGQVENLRFVIQESATIIVTASWRAEVEYEGNPCQNYFGEGFIQPYAYIFHVSVPKTNAPTLSADKDVVQIGTEKLSFSVQGCDPLLPNVEVFIASCDSPKPDNNKKVTGAISIYHFEAPRQIFNADTYYVRCTDNQCYGDWSNGKHIDIVATSNPCNDPVLEEINKIKPNDRLDTHFYKKETIVCQKSEANCTRQVVFDLIASNKFLNAPLASDLTSILPFGSGQALAGRVGATASLLGSALAFKADQSAVVDCKPVNLPGVIGIVANMVALYLDINQGQEQNYFKTRDFTASSPIFANPIGQYVDRGQFAVVNYTKLGHVLYPGRVFRQIVEDCDTIKVITIGIGNSLYGNTFDGQIMAGFNYYSGLQLFGSIDQRLIKAYNLLPK